MTTLESALVVSIHGFSKVYLVIDALDECPLEHDERKKLLCCLRRIHAAKIETLHLLCTSRREQDIEATLNPLLSGPGKFDINLFVKRQAVDQDIELYIEQSFASEDFYFWSGSAKQEAKTTMIKKADGM